MSRSQTFFILLPFVMIFFYQNCSPNGFDQGKQITDYKVSGIDQSFPPIELSKENVQEISFISNEPVLVNEKGRNIMIMMDLQYKVDLQAREVLKFNPKQGTTQKYCLSEPTFKNLRTALLSTSICKFLAEKDDNEVCSQAVVPAYARLITSRDSLDLGYSTDSCGTNKIDSCESDPNYIKGWIQHFLANLNTQTCE